MKILLVVTSESLPLMVTNVLNPKNDYCAFVVDEVQPAQEFAQKIGLSEKIIYPLYELKNLINEIYFDVVICVSDNITGISSLLNYAYHQCGCPKNKLVHYWHFVNGTGNFLVERALRYYQEHSDEIKIFATGNSHTGKSLDVNQFKYKLLNFGRIGQDLYYSYQIAKRVLTPKTGGGTNIRYVLMGVDPYFLHADNSQFLDSSLILNYVTAFNDSHNFWLPLEQYKSLFNENFLSLKLPLETFDINNVMFEKVPPNVMDFAARLKSRTASESWNNKYYPDTLKEYLKIFDAYLSLCIENNVRPIMVLYPVSECWAKYFNKKLLAEFYHFVNEAVKKYPETGFIDGWKVKGFDDSDFFDVDHLNAKGAAKFSAILNSVILQLEKF